MGKWMDMEGGKEMIRRDEVLTDPSPREGLRSFECFYRWWVVVDTDVAQDTDERQSVFDIGLLLRLHSQHCRSSKTLPTALLCAPHYSLHA